MQRIGGLLVVACFTAALLSGCGADNHTTTGSMLPSAPDTADNSSSAYTTVPTQENEIEDENTVDGSSEFEYSLNDDGTATITKYIGEGGEVLIPSMIDGHRVTSIGECLFVGNKNMVDSVVVPDSVTTLESAHSSIVQQRKLPYRTALRN